MGNVTPIPLVSGSSTQTSMVVNNNTGLSLTLTSVRVQDDQSDSQEVINSGSQFVDFSQCDLIGVNGSCSVTITAPPLSGSTLLTMTFVGNVNGVLKQFTGNQIITYSDKIASNQGFIFSSVNNNLFKGPLARASITMPVILDADYTGVTVSTTNPGISTSISCPSYTKGTLCNIFIEAGNNIGSNSTINTEVVISGSNPIEPATVQSLMDYTQGQNVHSASVIGFVGAPVVITQNSVANLITSGVNLVINPSDGTSPKLVWLVNTGLNTASSLAITPANPAITSITSNTCSSGSLNATSSCSFLVNVTSTTQSGQTSVGISYNDSVAAQLLGFNVVYLSPTPGPAMTMLAGAGSLASVPVGKSANLAVNVTNTGNILLSNISFTNITAPNPAITYDPSSTCNTAGTQSLAIGASCTLVIKYSPTRVESSIALNIYENASYLNQGGQTASYNGASFNTTYSSIAGVAILTIVPNSVSFAVRADNNDSQSLVFTVTNTGGTATPSAPTIILPAIPGFTSSGNTCTALAVGASCTISTQYGPTTVVESQVAATLLVNYLGFTGDFTESTTAALTFNSSNAALISISAESLSGGTGGLGTSGSPYTFYNSPTSQATAVITYQNTGTASATNFNVALGGLPVGYQPNLGATTCGVESTTTTLGAGSTCVVSLSGVAPTALSGLFNPYNLTGVLNVTLPGWSYTDASTGVNRNLNPSFNGSNTIYITAVPFASVTESNVVTGSGNSVHTESAIFTASTINSGAPLTISLQASIGGNITNIANNNCTLASNGSTCTITITYAANSPLTTYNYSYIIKPTGASTGIIQYISFTLN